LTNIHNESKKLSTSATQSVDTTEDISLYDQFQTIDKENNRFLCDQFRTVDKKNNGFLRDQFQTIGEFVKKDKGIQFGAIIMGILLGTTAIATPMLGTAVGASIALAAGILLLTKTSDTVVNNSASIGKKVGVSSMAIGVGLGILTAMPELFVSLEAMMGGNSSLGIGCIVGSNIANLLLILGGTAVVKKINSKGMSWKFNAAVMGISTIIFGAQMVFGTLNPVIGTLMLGGLGMYILQSLKIAQKDAANELKEKEAAKITQPSASAMEEEQEKKSWKKLFGKKSKKRQKSIEENLSLPCNIGLGLAGVAGLIGSAAFVVASATAFGTSLNVSPAVIGVLAVAIGTTLPEMMVNIKAVLKGDMDMAIGNIFGSNIFKMLMLGGMLSLTGTTIPDDLNPGETMLGLVNTSALGVSALLTWGALKMSKGELNRKHGIIALGLYGIYTAATLILGGGQMAEVATATAPATIATPPVVANLPIPPLTP